MDGDFCLRKFIEIFHLPRVIIRQLEAVKFTLGPKSSVRSRPGVPQKLPSGAGGFPEIGMSSEGSFHSPLLDIATASPGQWLLAPFPR